MESQKIQYQFSHRAPTFERSASWVADPGLLAAYVSLCKAPADGELLDVCCGTGIVSGAFRGRVKKLTGVDLTEAMVEQARQKLDAAVQGSAYELPFADNTFDVVISREAWHILDQPEKAVSEMFRVCKPGGQIIYGHIVPYSQVDYEWMKRIFKLKQPLHTNFPSAQDIKDRMAKAGFQNMSSIDYTLWESIGLWTDTKETTPEARQEIFDLYKSASDEIKKVHPFKIADGDVEDCWRWVITTGFKPK